MKQLDEKKEIYYLMRGKSQICISRHSIFKDPFREPIILVIHIKGNVPNNHSESFVEFYQLVFRYPGIYSEGESRSWKEFNKFDGLDLTRKQGLQLFLDCFFGIAHERDKPTHTRLKEEGRKEEHIILRHYSVDNSEYKNNTREKRLLGRGWIGALGPPRWAI
jgi:hypothetical protein